MRQPVHPLPETLPGPDAWSALLWPWCDRVDAELPHCAVVARSLAYAVDGRDGTVDTERVRVGTPGVHRRVVDELAAVGLLEPAHPGRHRVVLPEPVPARRGRRHH